MKLELPNIKNKIKNKYARNKNVSFDASETFVGFSKIVTSLV